MKTFNIVIAILTFFYYSGLFCSSFSDTTKNYWNTTAEYVVEKWQRFMDWVREKYDKIIHPYPKPQENPPLSELPESSIPTPSNPPI